MPNAFTGQAAGCNITVQADCEDALETLRTYLLPSLLKTSRRTGPREIILSVRRRPLGFRLSCDRVSEIAADYGALIVEATRLLDEALVKRLTGLAAVHAGAVIAGGQAVLLPGPTHAGKSMLVHALLQQGAEYLSDEYALLDARGHVHSYPRPLLLRNSGAEQVPALPEQWSGQIPEVPVPVGWILAVKYEAGGRWNIGPVAKSEALLLLLRNTPHALKDKPQTFEIFERASQAAQCYVGSRSDAQEAAGHILRMVAA